MKIIGWMHRKFWQNSCESLGKIATKPTFNRLTVRPIADDRPKYFVPRVPEKGRQWMFQDPPEASPLLDEGLLAIGTFGSPLITITEAEKMTAVEIAETETEEATEKDLMVMSLELKKVLKAESEKGKCWGDRTLSASESSAGKGTEACPLQGFLIGFPVDVGVTALVADGRRERRVSLGELFKNSGVEEVSVGGDKDDEMTAQGRNVMTNKMLQCGRSVRGNARGRGGKCDAAETNKFRKIMRIFHRKIHPESAAPSKKLLKPSRHEEKEMFHITNNCSEAFNGNSSKMDAERKEFKREGISRFKCHSYPQSSKGICRANSDGNKEHWIRTDAEYLVLEL